MRSAIKRLLPAPAVIALKAVAYRLRHGPNPDHATVFNNIYRKQLWGRGESVSGPGSTIHGTSVFRDNLERWLEANTIHTLVDLPCGDFHWMRMVRFPPGMTYIGVDIVPEIIATASDRYGRQDIQFRNGDILTSDLAEADAYLCKDIFIHFPNEAISAAIARVRLKTKFLLATTFPNTTSNIDIKFGDARRVNMELVLGKPVEILEEFDDKVKDRYVGVWQFQ